MPLIKLNQLIQMKTIWIFFYLGTQFLIEYDNNTGITTLNNGADIPRRSDIVSKNNATFFYCGVNNTLFEVYFYTGEDGGKNCSIHIFGSIRTIEAQQQPMITVPEYIDFLEATYPNRESRACDTENQFNCHYSMTKEGKEVKCAVGHCLISPKICHGVPAYHDCHWKIRIIEGNKPVLHDFINELKPEYRNIPVNVFIAAQRWHDNGKNFTESGLSDRGKFCLNLMKNGDFDWPCWETKWRASLNI